MKSLILVIALTSWSSLIYANSGDNACERLHITVTNATSSSCNLVGSRLRHGGFSKNSTIPKSIIQGETSHPIILIQNTMGPELELTYRCGEGKVISFVSQQNLCFFRAGSIHADINKQSGLLASYTIQEGSFFWSKYGTIQWKIYENTR